MFEFSNDDCANRIRQSLGSLKNVVIRLQTTVREAFSV
jgi:hypothetical protein